MSDRKQTNIATFEPPEMAAIRIRMAKDFSQFGTAEKDAFLLAFQEITGLGDSDIRNISFREGCVNFEAEIPLAVWRKFCAMYKSLADEPDSEALEPLRAFIEKFAIQDVTEQGVYAFHIRATDKTKPDNRDHVIFIHGWSGSANAFGDLPTFIEQQVHCRAVVYEYPTRRLAKSPAVSFLAQNFDNWIRNNAVHAPKLAFIAHSMGGLIVRKFVADQRRPWKEAPMDSLVKQITLVASPYDGSVLARLAALFSLNVQLGDLSPNSAMLFDMNREWEQWVRDNVPRNCRVRCVVSTADSIVNINNARGFDPNPEVLVDKDHTDIIKPNSKDDAIVSTLVRLLREAGIGQETQRSLVKPA